MFILGGDSRLKTEINCYNNIYSALNALIQQKSSRQELEKL